MQILVFYATLIGQASVTIGLCDFFGFDHLDGLGSRGGGRQTIIILTFLGALRNVGAPGKCLPQGASYVVTPLIGLVAYYVTDCRESCVTDVQFYPIRHMIDDATTKNTRLLDRDYSFLRLNTLKCNFWSTKLCDSIPANLTTLMSLLLFLFCRPHTSIFYRLLVYEVCCENFFRHIIDKLIKTTVQYPHPVTVSHLTYNLCHFYCRCNGAFCFLLFTQTDSNKFSRLSRDFRGGGGLAKFSRRAAG